MEVSKIVAAQCGIEGCKDKLELGTCNEATIKAAEDYWLPRIGDTFQEVAPLLQCLNSPEAFLKGDETSGEDYSYLYIGSVSCNEENSPDIDCLSEKDQISYWSEKPDHELNMVLIHKQVHMQNSTNLIQPVN